MNIKKMILGFMFLILICSVFGSIMMVGTEEEQIDPKLAKGISDKVEASNKTYDRYVMDGFLEQEKIEYFNNLIDRLENNYAKINWENVTQIEDHIAYFENYYPEPEPEPVIVPVIEENKTVEEEVVKLG